MRHIVTAGLLSACFLLVSPRVASAQTIDERGNVAISYSLLHDSDLEETFPLGWVAAVTRHLTPVMSVVGEVGGNYKSVDVLGDDINFRVHSYLGGVRFGTTRANFTPFAQALLGAATATASFEDESESTTGFTVQPGGGVDFRVTDTLNLRAQGDFRVIRSDGENSNEFRFAAGVVFGF